MSYDIIVVGGGIAGLTAAAYSAKDGYKTALFERGEDLGGLVSSFDYKGFRLDGGIRSIENSGIVLPMLKQLEIDVPFERSVVSLGLKDDVIRIESIEAVKAYEELLIKHFPDNVEDIRNIGDEIRKIMKYMDILYGIDNPLFLDIKKDRKYFITKIFPWMFQYAFTFRKVTKRRTPVDEYLASFTDNQALIDVIGQHFFQKTPAFFALSYFSLYLDYNYPKGGTGTLIDKVAEFVRDHGTEIHTETRIVAVDPITKTVTDEHGETHGYRRLVWAADNKALYGAIDIDKLPQGKMRDNIMERKEYLAPMRGSDSVYTSYLFVNEDASYFKNINSGHFFYTPKLDGLSGVGLTPPLEAATDKATILKWLDEYFEYNTFEISIPAVRDASLAPAGKTALIVSTLMDYDLVKTVHDMGWYDEFKQRCEELFIDVLDRSIYPGLKDKVEGTFSSSPLTIEHRTGNTDGAIVGWAFTNGSMAAVNSLPLIAKSVNTPIPDVYQAGQWSYSPAGLPISILTGKLASDKAKKKLKK